MVWTLLTKLITGEANVYLARLRAMAIIYVVMGVLALLAFLSALGILAVYLVEAYGPLTTAIGFTVGWIVLLILAWIGLIIVRRPPKKRAEDRVRRDIASIAGVAAVSNMPAIFQQVGKRKSLLFLPVVGAIGYGAWMGFQSLRGR